MKSKRSEQSDALHAFAHLWAKGEPPCLTLAALGDIFGSDFWMLFQQQLPPEVVRMISHPIWVIEKGATHGCPSGPVGDKGIAGESS